MSLAPPKPSPLVPGYRLDRYELLCPIARGGMAEVWVARLRGKHGFEKLVAIKTILPQFAQEPSFQRMFLDEAHIASGIQHQNVAQILDLGEEHEVLYLVMEWVDGDALSKLQRAVEKKKTKIPIGIVLRILSDACGALHAAHELSDAQGHNLGVVHRDVSPQNILVSDKGVAKLIDFGIAKARDRVSGDTAAGVLKGKLQYMAPEQALGKVVDRRADVWAIGAILHHLVSGRPPFEADNQLATLHLLASGRPPPVLPKEVPDAVADVVRRALKHDVAKRIGSAAELQKAIENAMAEAWVTTSAADVALFLADHLADRAESRRKAVELALKAAGEREKMLALLKPTADGSGSVSNVQGRLDALLKSGALPADRAPDEIDLEVVAPRPTTPPIAETSSTTTLGSTTLEPPPPPFGLHAGRRKWIVLGTLAGALALLVFASISVLVRAKPQSREDPRTPATNGMTKEIPEPRESAPGEDRSSAVPIAAASTSASATTATSSASTTSTSMKTEKPPQPWPNPLAAKAVTPAGTAKPATPPIGTATAKKKPKYDDGF